MRISLTISTTTTGGFTYPRGTLDSTFKQSMRVISCMDPPQVVNDG